MKVIDIVQSLTVINEQWIEAFEVRQQLDLDMTFYHNQMASNSYIAFIEFNILSPSNWYQYPQLFLIKARVGNNWKTFPSEIHPN